jgi:AAA15 family ATPase/GTPase
MISIKKNKKPDLKVCKFMCDTKLDDKLDKYELTKFLNKHSVNLIVGKPGSGKTNLLYSLFKSKQLLKGIFDKIIIFQPVQSQKSMKDNIFGKLPDEQRFDELTLENLEDANDQLLEDGNNCIIFDDMGAYLKNGETKRLFKEMVYNRRHKHLTIFFLVQSWFNVEKDLRKLFTNIFIFKISKSELENIYDEVIETPKEQILEISKMVFDAPYNFLFINTDSNKMFKNFDEIIISKD